MLAVVLGGAFSALILAAALVVDRGWFYRLSLAAHCLNVVVQAVAGSWCLVEIRAARRRGADWGPIEEALVPWRIRRV